MSVQLGINPLTWTNDDLPSLGAETSLETCLSEGKEAGFAGFELGNKFPREARLLGPILQRHGLQLVSGWYSSRLARRSVAEEIEAIVGHVELLKRNGATVLVYGEVADSIQGSRIRLIERPRFHSEQAWQDYADKLTELARFTLSQGVRLAYHHHMGAYCESPQDLDTLMKLTSPNVGLLFDTGHITFAGGNALAELKKHIGRVVHVHCKDVRENVMLRARNTDQSFLNSVLDGVFTVPGDGMIDFAPILQELANRNYTGWLVVEAEQDPAVAPSYEYAKKGYDTLAGLVRQINGQA